MSTATPAAADLSPDELRELATRAGVELEGAHPEEILAWAARTFGRDLVVASSMGDEVLVHMAARAVPGIDVIFLDTGYHFAETIGTRDAVEAVYDIKVVNVTAEHTPAEQDQLVGKDLFASNPTECCRLRKVVPLRKSLQGYSAWVTGIRRVEAPTRANAPLISFDEAFKLVMINPLGAWTDEDMNAYIEANGVLVNPLVEEGYPSIGCAPCTAKPAEGADPRSGRWQGLSKTECGLHVS